jgi:hypothetical protein
MSTDLPEAVTDPVGVVVGLITDLEPSLDRATVVRIVEGVAGGRAKRRRLAQALAARPEVLADGRSPAPRAVGDLLIALRAAGAVRISPPVCARCGKQLRTMQRRGEDWYCGVCGPNRVPCTGCRNLRTVGRRDRDGRPYCMKCPPDDDDPVAIVVDVVAGVAPTVPAQTVTAAVHAAVPRSGRRRELAWALQDRPELLTGAGAAAPAPSVLRLIDALCQDGAAGIVRPPCPHCARAIPLVKRRAGVWLCRNCVAKSRAVPCTRCQAVREPAARDEHGQPLCATCLISEPANLETCTGCGRRRRVAVRLADGPRCDACRPWKVRTCGICGRTAPCLISQTTGQPWCKACKQRWARCAGCEIVKPIRGGTAEAPLCATCTRPDPDFWRTCPSCGQTGQLRDRPCVRCNLRGRLLELLGDESGQIRPELQALHDNLATYQRPTTVLRWLDKDTAAAVLREIGVGRRPLTHAALDELPDGKPIAHLRSILVATGALPVRDEHLARLERWITRLIAERTDPDQRQLLRRYGLWHLVRRLRGRLRGQHATHQQATVVQQHLRAAVALLDWLTGRSLSLATCQQRDLDDWLADAQTSYRRDAGHFVRWTRTQKLTTLEFPAVRWGGPGSIDTEARWQQARWLLHDQTLKPEDRLAGLLVLLYAQWPATISRLTLDHLDDDGDQVRLRLGGEPVVLPEPLADMVRQLAATRRGHAGLGDQGTSPWLFPGGQPGRPLSAFRLADRLRQLGLHSGRARSAALFQLATELPAALLARLLGIHVSVAVAWQRASAGDWTTYAADIARRGVQAPTDRT